VLNRALGLILCDAFLLSASPVPLSASFSGGTAFDNTAQDVPLGLASGTGAFTNGPLGTFDPTLLLNGNYELRFTAHRHHHLRGRRGRYEDRPTGGPVIADCNSQYKSYETVTRGTESREVALARWLGL
jgi:hypothetical protein